MTEIETRVLAKFVEAAMRDSDSQAERQGGDSTEEAYHLGRVSAFQMILNVLEEE